MWIHVPNKIHKHLNIPAELQAVAHPESGKLYRTLKPICLYKNTEFTNGSWGNEIPVGTFVFISNYRSLKKHPCVQGPAMSIQVIVGEMIGWTLTDIHWESYFEHVNPNVETSG